MEKENYEERIDILRCIGLVLIIVAHTISSNWILELRSFDVPLMVVVSGILAIDSYKREKNYFRYLKKRVVRLLVPTYMFFLFFFIAVFIGSKILNISYPFTPSKVINTLFLLDGVGYVWIIRVYLLTAIVTPFLLKIKEKLNIYVQLAVCIITYIFYEIIFAIVGNTNVILAYFVYFIIPYSMVVLIGMNAKQSKNFVKKVAIIAFIIFCITFAFMTFYNNGIIRISQYKYPPRVYYLSYTIFMSMVCILLVNLIKIKDNKLMKLITFISRHSMWIYLWHAAYVFIAEWINLQGVAKLFLVLTLSIVTTVVQNKILDCMNKDEKQNILLKVLRS